MFLTIKLNPLRGKLFVENPNIQVEQIIIYDLNGRVVLNSKKLENNSINLSLVNKGVYILRLKTNLGILQKKIVKE